MTYYTALHLTKEPFSTSPDPAFFFYSAAHSAALHRQNDFVADVIPVLQR